MQTGKVLSVNLSPTHSMGKEQQEQITLLKGLGVEGDAHMGKTIKHRSRVAKNPDAPNVRQVHLIHSELLEALREKGFTIWPGEMGENITTAGVDLLGLPENTILKIGAEAQVQITGLRSPCRQLNGVAEGLMEAVLDKDEEGNLIRKSGVMGIVKEGGTVQPGDKIVVLLPETPHRKLEAV